MINRALLSAIAACSIATGCAAATPDIATPMKGKQRGGCEGERCVVKIRVTDENSTPCKFEYRPDKLSVYGKKQKIRFVAEGGWHFEQNGIELPSGGNQFSGHAGAGTATFSVVDANSDKNTYKYKTRVTKGAKKCEGDPSVVNGADYADPNYP